MKHALIVGGGGFVGQHLAAHLVEEGFAVTGAGRSGAPEGWAHEWITADVRAKEAVHSAVGAARPDVIFQLASPGPGDLGELLAVGVLGTANVLDAAAAAAPGARVIVAGSAAEYGHVPDDSLPVVETQTLRPVSRYGVAKAAQTLLALSPGGTAIVGRIFNVAGPGEPATLVCGAIASQIARLEAAGAAGVIDVGNLDAERDFVDVRDVARALAVLAKAGTPGEVYNICSGEGLRIGDVLARLLDLAQVQVEACFDAARAARPDVPRMVGSAEKLQAATGWSPALPIERTLADLLDAQRLAPTAS